jgi:hypothetical protein
MHLSDDRQRINRMTAGRPTKLTPELLEKAKQYIDGGYLLDELVPTVAGFSLFLGISKQTAYEWAKINQEFSDFLEEVMRRQEKGLLKGGLAGDYNSTIAKLMLTKHGYTDKQETAHTGPDGGPVQYQEVTRTVVDPQN